MKPLHDMTADELIAFAGHHTAVLPMYESTIELINVLCDKLTPNSDEIHIVWRVKDVYEMAEHLGKDHPTEEQARAILKRMEEMGYAAGWQHMREIL